MERHKRALVIAMAVTGRVAVVAESTPDAREPIGEISGIAFSSAELIAFEQKMLALILHEAGIGDDEIIAIADDIDREDRLLKQIGSLS